MVLDGHALRIVDELKKRRALGAVPLEKPSTRSMDISSFMDLHKKQQKKEARKYSPFVAPSQCIAESCAGTVLQLFLCTQVVCYPLQPSIMVLHLFIAAFVQ